MSEERRKNAECDLRDVTFCILGFTIVIGFFLVEWLILTGRAARGGSTEITTILNNTNSLVMFVAGAFFGKAVSDKLGPNRDGTPQTTITTSMSPDKTTTKIEPTPDPLQAEPKSGV